MLALIVGLGGFGQFTVTYFVPSVAKALYGLDATAAASSSAPAISPRSW